MKRQQKLSTAIKNLDKVFAQWVKLSNANLDGWIECITCGRYFRYEKIDCGHYVSRDFKSVRWDERNVAPQCQSCNRYHEGRKDVFALKLQEKYGPGILQELNDKKNEIKKWTPDELKDMLEDYKNKIKEMEK